MVSDKQNDIELQQYYTSEYTEEYLEDLLEATYRVAPKVYSRYRWDDRFQYTVDDYTQDAAMHVFELFKQQYIVTPETNKNLDNLVYTLLNTHWTYNKYKALRVTNNHNNVSIIDGDNNDDTVLLGINLNTILDMESDIERLQQTSYGNKLLLEIADNVMDFVPYRTTKHKYIIDNTLMTEYNLAIRVLNGDTVNKIAKDYNATDDNQLAVIRQRYNKVVSKIEQVSKDLDTYERQAIRLYLESIGSNED